MVGKIVIHPGFHKTGTTSLQATLRQNGPVLWRSTALAIGPKIEPIRRAARGFSTYRDQISLLKFSLRLNAYLGELALPENRNLVISSEEIAGHMPGRKLVPDYGALPILMREVVEVLEGRFGTDLDLTFYLSTRNPDSWLQSAWAQQVKGSRMILDYQDFQQQYGASANLAAMVARIAEAVMPYKVVTHGLEDSQHLKLGPAEPILKLLDLPAAKFALLKPVRIQNVSPPSDVLQQCLELNRTNLDEGELLKAKRLLFAAAFKL